MPAMALWLTAAWTFCWLTLKQSELVSCSSVSPLSTAPPVTANPNSLICDVRIFSQKVDHLSAWTTSAARFDQRYLVCQENWIPGGPLLFYTGSEADIMSFVNNSGFVFELAAELNGMIVFAEHRYYGKSIPFDGVLPLTTDTMAWLTVDNALEDFHQLIIYLKETITGLSNASVVTIGGSYGGLLSAWMRMRYPETVTGAISSSAPIQLLDSAEAPCNVVAQSLTRTYESVSSTCANAIRRSWTAVDNLFSDQAGRDWLKDVFRPCRGLSEYSRRSFMEWLRSAWTYMAITNYPHPADVFKPLPGWPVKTACSYLNDSDLLSDDRSLLKALADAVFVYYNHTGQVGDCHDLNDVVSSDWPSLQWGHQYCRELHMPYCSDGINDISYAVNSYNSCPEETLNSSVPFRGDDMSNRSNIIFSNGKLDPFLHGSLAKKSLPSSIILLEIEHAAHHLDLRGSRPDDPLSVFQARRQETEIIREWIDADRRRNLTSNNIAEADLSDTQFLP